MAEQGRENVMSVELAIQRELAYRRKITMLNLQTNAESGQELIPLQVCFSSPGGNASSRPISNSNLSLSGEKQAAPPSNRELLSGNASSRPISSSNTSLSGVHSSSPSRNASSRTISNSNLSLSGEKQPTPPRNQELPGGNASSWPNLSSNPCLSGVKPRAPPSNEELLSGNASSRPISSSNPSLCGVKRPAPPSNPELPSGSASSRPRSSSNPSISGVKQSAPSSNSQFLQLQLLQSFNNDDMLEPRADNLFCEVCQVTCPGPFNYKQHISSKRHQFKVQELKFSRKDGEDDYPVANQRGRKWCSLCRIWCMNDDLMKLHLAGQKHKKEQDRLKLAQIGEMTERPNWCELCGIGCTDGHALQMHLKGKKHQTELRMRECGRTRGNDVEKQQKVCHLCNIWCIDEVSLQSHLVGKKHVLRELEVKKIEGCCMIDYGTST
ncbi:hypothetical protein SLEP1_g43824 [Rubroshorea leprosula]|uniref:C2H2-type domain-containing protein n=1 Tax=Rubroshorea leprosula TaxID=152421 RepID=A0AAV5LFB8_9ROSI|nr:hypothetical protein SLEP1_g43824 [Rubroshorea leprosula]